MKLALSLVLLGGFLCVAILPASAAKKGQAAPGRSEKALPSTDLRSMIDRTMPKLQTLAVKNAPALRSDLATAQAEYVAEAQTAPATDKQMYQAAAHVVKTLLAAVEEHDQAASNFQYSKSVHGAQDNKDSEVTNAVGNGRANNAKQNRQNADSRNELLAKEKFLSKGSQDAWTTRVGQLRAAVEQTYTTEVTVEKQTVAARAAAVAALTPPKSTPAPVKPPKPAKAAESASEEFTPVGTWQAGKSHWIFREDNTFNHPPGNGEWKWKDQSTGLIELTWRKGKGKQTTATFSADGRTLKAENQNGELETLKR